MYEKQEIMEETTDKDPTVDQKISKTKFEKRTNDTNPSGEQIGQQVEAKISKDNTPIDENLTALYWG